MLQIADGYFEGGTAATIAVGFDPRYVQLVNLTAATEVIYGMVADDILRFDGGGTDEIVGGYYIRASDGGWSARVKEVILTSGSWSGGDAAGYLILEAGSLEGETSLADNDTIRVATNKGETPSGDWGTLNTGTNYGRAYDLDGEVAFITTISPAEKGFSVTTGLGTASDLIYYVAFGSGAG